jgi:hypothetical protein
VRRARDSDGRILQDLLELHAHVIVKARPVQSHNRPRHQLNFTTLLAVAILLAA